MNKKVFPKQKGLQNKMQTIFPEKTTEMINLKGNFGVKE
jgi:hypothetical protein